MSYEIARCGRMHTPAAPPKCGLTPRSTGPATAGHLGPVGGTRYIFANRAKASCLRGPVSSNVDRNKLAFRQPMNHLEAINAGIAAKTPYAEIVRKVFLTYPTQAFVGQEDQQFAVLNEISEHFGIPITSVQVTGSAKLGRSLHKHANFRPGESDLDVAIIDSRLFITFMELVLRQSKGYSDRTAFPLRDGQSTQEEYIRYLARGIFRPDLMPTGPNRANWRDFFGRLSRVHANLFRSISAAIYLSQACFESKQRSAIRSHAENGPL